MPVGAIVKTKNNSVTSLRDTDIAKNTLLQVYPNPLQVHSKTRYISVGDAVNIALIDLQGSVVKLITG